MGEPKIEYVSVAEYLAQEEINEFKSEYHDGLVVAMSGGTLNHGIAAGNIFIALDKITDGGKCRVFNSEIRVQFQKNSSFVYPDAYVVCGDVETSEEDKNAIINPVLVVEVLSKSTEGYDRGEKFRKYCSLPSFKEYLLITQDKPIVDLLYKKDENSWFMTTIIGLDKSVYINTLTTEISMKEIYRNVNF